MSDLQSLGKACTDPDEYILNIARKGFRRRDVILWPPRLHQGSKAPVIDNLEWSVIFCDPADKFGTANDLSVSVISQINMCAKRTVLQAWYAGGDYTRPFLRLPGEMRL